MMSHQETQILASVVCLVLPADFHKDQQTDFRGSVGYGGDVLMETAVGTNLLDAATVGAELTEEQPASVVRRLI